MPQASPHIRLSGSGCRSQMFDGWGVCHPNSSSVSDGEKRYYLWRYEFMLLYFRYHVLHSNTSYIKRHTGWFCTTCDARFSICCFRFTHCVFSGFYFYTSQSVICVRWIILSAGQQPLCDSRLPCAGEESNQRRRGPAAADVWTRKYIGT